MNEMQGARTITPVVGEISNAAPVNTDSVDTANEHQVMIQILGEKPTGNPSYQVLRLEQSEDDSTWETVPGFEGGVSQGFALGPFTDGSRGTVVQLVVNLTNKMRYLRMVVQTFDVANDVQAVVYHFTNRPQGEQHDNLLRGVDIEVFDPELM